MNAAPLVGLFVGFALTAVLWNLASPIFQQQIFLRENFRGRQLMTSSGLLIAPMMMIVAALVSVGTSIELDMASDLWLGVTVASVLSIGLVFLGLLDDLAGDATTKGFKGHIGAAAHGRLTTGMIKLIGGVSLSLLAASMVTLADEGIVALIRVAMLIALCTNLANLFDLAPARAAKVSLLVWLACVPWHLDVNALFGPSLVLGGVLMLSLPELKERAMLGDAGANALGGAVGLTIALSWGSAVQWTVVVFALMLTLASEKVSFSKIIRQNKVLHWVDMLGRQPLDPPNETLVR